MTTYRIALLAAAVVLVTIPARAQTAGELLQKGIYTQDTAGDPDGAIAIYRQIINSGNSPRDIAAQAQYRLAQSLLQKGDLANGATEFSNLARNYADYSKLISSLAAEANRSLALGQPPGPGGRGGADRTAMEAVHLDNLQNLKAVLAQLNSASGGGRGGPASQLADEELRAQIERLKIDLTARQRELATVTFDSNSPVNVKGVIFKFQVMNPNSMISIDPMDGSGKRYTFLLASASQLMKQGLTRNTIRMGDEATVAGSLSTGGQMLPDGTIAALATTITNASGATIYDRGQVTQ